MPELHVVTALQNKHARLQGELKASDAKSRKIIRDLHHIEHVIRMFKQEFEPRELKPIRPAKPSQWRRARVGTRHAIEVLRTADRPLTAVELAYAALERAGEPIPDKWGIWSIANTFNTALKRRVGNGIVMHEGRPRRWGIGDIK